MVSQEELLNQLLERLILLEQKRDELNAKLRLAEEYRKKAKDSYVNSMRDKSTASTRVRGRYRDAYHSSGSATDRLSIAIKEINDKIKETNNEIEKLTGF